MPGVPDRLYVRARAALLDAVEALETHLDAVVLVGAQAIYQHTGDADLAVAEYTTDADFSVSPAELADAPLLGDLLAGHGFTPREHPGQLAQPRRHPHRHHGPRGPRRSRHAWRPTRATRQAGGAPGQGLEGALVDRDRHSIAALDPSDNRQISMWVAGPGALLVAKVHKIAERVDASDRVRDKDALDVLRLLRAIDTDGLAARLRSLVAHDVAGPVTTEAVGLVRQLFGTEQSDGVVMAVRAAGTSEDAAMITGSMVALATDVTSALG